MNVKDLKEVLNIFHDEMEVFVQTVPDDFASPLEMKNVSLLPMQQDEKSGRTEPPKLLFTAHFPRATP